MLVGVASLPPSFPSSGTYAFYSRNRQNCVNIYNTVYLIASCSTFGFLNVFDPFSTSFPDSKRQWRVDNRLQPCRIFSCWCPKLDPSCKKLDTNRRLVLNSRSNKDLRIEKMDFFEDSTRSCEFLIFPAQSKRHSAEKNQATSQKSLG